MLKQILLFIISTDVQPSAYRYRLHTNIEAANLCVQVNFLEKKVILSEFFWRFFILIHSFCSFHSLYPCVCVLQSYSHARTQTLDICKMTVFVLYECGAYISENTVEWRMFVNIYLHSRSWIHFVCRDCVVRHSSKSLSEWVKRVNKIEMNTFLKLSCSHLTVNCRMPEPFDGCQMITDRFQ